MVLIYAEKIERPQRIGGKGHPIAPMKAPTPLHWRVCCCGSAVAVLKNIGQSSSGSHVSRRYIVSRGIKWCWRPDIEKANKLAQCTCVTCKVFSYSFNPKSVRMNQNAGICVRENFFASTSNTPLYSQTRQKATVWPYHFVKTYPSARLWSILSCRCITFFIVAVRQTGVRNIP